MKQLFFPVNHLNKENKCIFQDQPVEKTPEATLKRIVGTPGMLSKTKHANHRQNSGSQTQLIVLPSTAQLKKYEATTDSSKSL